MKGVEGGSSSDPTASSSSSPVFEGMKLSVSFSTSGCRYDIVKGSIDDPASALRCLKCRVSRDMCGREEPAELVPPERVNACRAVESQG